jgi:hypothetical protein
VGPTLLSGPRLVASLAVLAVVVSSLVVVVVVSGPDDPQTRSVPAVDTLAVATAASFAEAVTTLDPAVRAQAIGRWVVQSRIPEFVKAFEGNFRDEQRRGGTLKAVPRAYKLAQSSPDVAVVLVWKELLGTGNRPAQSFEVSAYGVMRKGTVWQVYSYEGTVRDVRTGDRRLDGFRPLYHQQGRVAP